MPPTLALSSQTPHPPTSTLLLLNLPPSLLLGIDLLTLTTPSNSSFHGIKNLPPGPHFVFVAETPSHSLRAGFWFFVPATSCPPALIVRAWDADSSSLALCPSNPAEEGAQRARLLEVWEAGLMPYRQSATTHEPDPEAGAWPELTAHITPALLTRLLSDPCDWAMTTSSCAPQDRDDIPGLGAGDARWGGGIGAEPELRTLGIDLKRTWRAGAVGRERTEGAVDRSWALENLVAWMAKEGGGVGLMGEGETETETETETESGENGHDGQTSEQEWGATILGQLEATFIATITLANYSSLEEWKRILSLALTCTRALATRPTFFAAFIRQLRAQLRAAARCCDVDNDGAFLDASDADAFLRPLVSTFRRSLARAEGVFPENLPCHAQRSTHARALLVSETRRLETWLRAEYGWELDGAAVVRRGFVRLEDGESVELEMEWDGDGGGGWEEGEGEGEMESGEYAPMVVELG